MMRYVSWHLAGSVCLTLAEPNRIKPILQLSQASKRLADVLNLQNDCSRASFLHCHR